jgi:hypothetical protein
MSAEVIVRVQEDTEKKQLNMEVRLEQEGGTELEKMIVARLQPMMEMYLDRFQEIHDEEGQPKELPRIITP